MSKTKTVRLFMMDIYSAFVHTLTPLNIPGQIIVIRDHSFEYQSCDMWNMTPCILVDECQRLERAPCLHHYLNWRGKLHFFLIRGLEL